MKKFLLPIALFAAFGLAACGDEIEEAGCSQADQIEGSSCDISKVEVCPDDEVYKYNGKEFSDSDISGLLDALKKDGYCSATVSPEEKLRIQKALRAQSKKLLDRIRVNAIRAI